MIHKIRECLNFNNFPREKVIDDLGKLLVYSEKKSV